QRIARRSRDTLDPLSFVEHASRLRDHLLTGRGKQDIALPALEELRIELILEVLYRRAQARLAHEAAFGGTAEMSFLRERDNVAKLGMCHILRSAGMVGKIRLSHSSAQSIGSWRRPSIYCQVQKRNRLLTPRGPIVSLILVK